MTGCAACLLALKFVKWLWHVQNLWIWLGSSIYLHSEAKTKLKLHFYTRNFLNSFHITSSDQTHNSETTNPICFLKMSLYIKKSWKLTFSIKINSYSINIFGLIWFSNKNPVSKQTANSIGKIRISRFRISVWSCEI